VITTLALRDAFEAEKASKGWKLDPSIIHVDEKGKPFTRPDHISKLLKGAYAEAGIDTKVWKPNNARHAVITFYKSRGITDEQLKLITGHSHSSKVLSDYYTHPVKEWADRSIFNDLATQRPVQAEERRQGKQDNSAIRQVTDLIE
jgi:hypothetical protein